MDSIDFLVQGSANDPYKVSFQKVNSNLLAFCTCAAGKGGQFCKHRTGILIGSSEGVVSNNKDQINLVVTWLSGSSLELALIEVQRAEADLDQAKKRASSAKRKLASVAHT